jgi:hypothetical protein
MMADWLIGGIISAVVTSAASTGTSLAVAGAQRGAMEKQKRAEQARQDKILTQQEVQARKQKRQQEALVRQKEEGSKMQDPGLGVGLGTGGTILAGGNNKLGG